MRTSFHHQPEAQHPNFQLSTSWPADLRNRMASIFPLREYAAAGGLMSYGESLREFYRRAAPY
jgi:hypothetical protein